MDEHELMVEGRVIMLDKHGHLVDRADWSPTVGDALARRDNQELTPEHWDVIRFVQRYYDDFGIAPPMRALVKAYGKATGAVETSSRELYRLFPESPAKLACRYGGLPKPISCI